MATASSESQLSGRCNHTIRMESPKPNPTLSSGASGCPPSLRSGQHAAAMSAWDARSMINSAVFMSISFGSPPYLRTN